MAAEAEMIIVRAMDVAGGTNGTMSTDVVAAAEARAMDVVAETTRARDMDVGTETDAT